MRKTYLDLADNEIARLDLILLRTLFIQHSRI